MKKLTAAIFGAALLSFATHGPALALDQYPVEQQQQFIDWCTGSKSLSESVCSCTVKRLAQTVAPTALAVFLSNNGMPSMSQSAIATTAAVTEALTACSQ